MAANVLRLYCRNIFKKTINSRLNSPNQKIRNEDNNMSNEFRKLKRTKKYITNSDKFQLLPKKFMSVDIHARKVQIVWKFGYLRFVSDYE